MSSYDENLKDNPFLQEILLQHFDLIEKASQDNWLICIPRNGTFSTPIKEQDILEHILIPTDINNSYNSLNKTNFVIENNKIAYTNISNIKNKTSEDIIKIKILFNETFYLKQFKYKVICIENAIKQNHIYDNAFKTIESLTDCINMLYTVGCGDEILTIINDISTTFLLDNENLITYTLQSLKDCSFDLYNKCLDEALKIAKTKMKIDEKNTFIQRQNSFKQKTNSLNLLEPKYVQIVPQTNNIQISVETYLQYCLNNQFFAAICTCLSHADANFNKKVRNLQNVQLKHFKSINNDFNLISSAKFELNKLNKFTTTLGKINCLRNSFKIVSHKKLTSEMLLETFIFIIIKLNISNWLANLEYLKHFVFSSSDNSNETSFLITTLEAALEYIKSNTLFEQTDIETNASQNELFLHIKLGNLKNIEALLMESQKHANEPKLCHPLCSCIDCEQILNLSEFSIHSKDEKGRGLLHLACIYEYPQLVEFFIQKGCITDSIDYSGACPIHYSALKGHQNALLLLLHSGANINVPDSDGNTALHLASNNGHENCVKALLYYSEHKTNVLNIDFCNNHGDTPLHLASKWGYLNIVAILLQYNADINVKNKINMTPLELAHNYFIKKMILNENVRVKEILNDKIETIPIIESNEEIIDKTESDCHGVSPKNLYQFKKTDLLLKAIENNDYPLTCFYLGVFYPTAISDQSKTCHPLCNCEKCDETDYYIETAPLKPKEHLNVNICNVDGYTSLHVAAQFGRSEILRLLLDIGADVNLKTYKSHYTALHLAAINQRLQVLKELLQCGTCEIDSQDTKGNTALNYACAINNVRSVEVLLTYGADIFIKNNDGRTVLDEAEANVSLNIVRLIKEKCTSGVGNKDEFLI